MSIFKCKMCGGTIEFEQGATVGVCDSCGTKQTLPRLDDDKKANLYDRANHFRRNNEYDKAMSVYEKILNEDTTDAEAYWSLVLCKYGVEYVDDPLTHKKVPTVNRTQFTSIYMDEDYKSALKYADDYQKEIYWQEAKAIDEIQNGILAISKKEEPFDVFICYKETDSSGRRTQDSVLANDLYHQLTQEGFKVFFSRITLEDKLGTAYEPYIFAALNSSKVMVVIGTKPEYFNAVWVKNEWSRYLSLIKNGANKILIPAYRDMDPYDLPEEFSHLQAQDMSKLGFMQDLIRGIKKIVGANDSKDTNIRQTTASNSSANLDALIKRIFLFLEDEDWDSVYEYCERVLDIDPENTSAYLGELMADCEAHTKEELKESKESFADNTSYQKIVRFGDSKLKQELQEYITIIEERNEAERIEQIYQDACDLMTRNQETAYLEAAELFGSVLNYKDSADKQTECKEKAESARKDVIFNEAKKLMEKKEISSYEKAINKFESIAGWRNSFELASQCKHCIEEINFQEEQKRLEAIRKEEQERLEAAQKEEAKKRELLRVAKRRRKKIIITLSSIIATVIAIVAIVNVSNYIKYKPLSDAFNENKVTTEYIRQNYSNLRCDKGALQVFKKELEACHKQNDLKRALEILVILAESDVAFDESEDVDTYMHAWFSFTEWVYSQAQSKGKKIPIEDYTVYGLVDYTYEVYGYKLSILESEYGDIFEVGVYIPSVGWYEVHADEKNSSNRSYHFERGGVMVN